MSNNTSKDKIYAGLFGNNPAVSLDERARVINELEKVGSLTFDVSKNAQGWSAQCAELPSIITGGTNPNPSENEIESEIRSAIFAAFNVHETELDMKSPYFGIRDFSHDALKHGGDED